MARSAFVVALEGPSDSGKSSLSVALRESLGEGTVVLPCYADLIGRTESLPDERGKTVQEQLDHLCVFVDLDHARTRRIPTDPAPQFVIADRSWLTFAAHLFAVEETGGPRAYQRGVEVLRKDANLLDPDLVIYLDASEATRAGRADSRDVGRWFTGPEFNRQVSRFFSEQAAKIFSGPVLFVDADQTLDSVCRAARAAIVGRSSGRP